MKMRGIIDNQAVISNSLTQHELLVFRALAHAVVVPDTSHLRPITLTSNCRKNADMLADATRPHVIIISPLKYCKASGMLSDSYFNGIFPNQAINAIELISRQLHDIGQVPYCYHYFPLITNQLERRRKMEYTLTLNERTT